MEIVKQRVELFTQIGNKSPHLVELAKKTGLDTGYILLGGLVLTALITLITMGGTILTVVLTVAYPAYKSIKALESAGDDDDKIWLTYWCVFGVFSLLDEFGGIILHLIPFYFYIKLGFFVWMMHPTTKGSTVVYNNVLKPLLDKNRDKIEKFIAEVKGGAMSVAKEGANAAMSELQKPENLMKGMNLAN
jgi:receptor expression-enhancing protein 5/6